MTVEQASRWRLGLIAIACTSLVMGSGFMACGSEDSATTGGGGAGGTGAGGVGTCDIATCPDPPFTGLEKCCTTDGMCGVKSAGMATCFPPNQAGTGGAGGMGGGKL
jgi:hypothetical protein